MQMSFIHGGNICVRRESVFRLSVGRSAPAVSQHECVRDRGYYQGVTTGRSNPRKRSWHPQYLSWPNLYFTSDPLDQWQLRRQLLHHDSQGAAASILIDISLWVRRREYSRFMLLVKQISGIQSYLSILDSRRAVDFGKMTCNYRTVFVDKRSAQEFVILFATAGVLNDRKHDLRIES